MSAMGYHTSKPCIPYQTPSTPPYHAIISNHKALQLCPSTHTPNHLVWI